MQASVSAIFVATQWFSSNGLVFNGTRVIARSCCSASFRWSECGFLGGQNPVLDKTHLYIREDSWQFVASLSILVGPGLRWWTLTGWCPFCSTQMDSRVKGIRVLLQRSSFLWAKRAPTPARRHDFAVCRIEWLPMHTCNRAKRVSETLRLVWRNVQESCLVLSWERSQRNPK